MLQPGGMGLLSVFLLVMLPFLTGIILFSRPRSGRSVLPFVYLSSSILAALMLLSGQTFSISLEGSFGVELLMDQVAWTFVLMNGLVFLGVTLSLENDSLPGIAFPLMALLHGTANAVFMSYDLFNVFVCIELSGILAFLLIRLGNKPRQVWSAVQYLIAGNVGMILYLLGCLYAYTWSGSFSMDTLKELPKLPVYLLITGLSVKGGVFLMGLWLPEAHGEAESAVSALLSGVIVKTGIAPLLRIASLSSSALDVVSVLAVLTALFGVFYAVFERDIKKMLAYHTISQTGFMLALPGIGHLYALAHGLFKGWLFLSAGKLDSRDLKELKKRGISLTLWIPIFLGALAISGIPGLGGFGGKAMIFNGLREWQIPFMYIAALGTCLSFAKLIFIPVIPGGQLRKVLSTHNVFFLVSLVALEIMTGYFRWSSAVKSLLLVVSGWAVYQLLMRGSYRILPKWSEDIDHIIGLTFLTILGMIGVFGL